MAKIAEYTEMSQERETPGAWERAVRGIKNAVAQKAFLQLKKTEDTKRPTLSQTLT